MAFSYTAGSTANLDRIRLLIGDTDSAAPDQQRLEDAEITDLLTIYGSYRAAAAGAADALAAKFARLATGKSMGQASLQWRRFDQLVALAQSLRNSAARAAVPFAGGMSKAIRDTNTADTDLIQPRFRSGMLDNPSSLDASTSE